MLNLKFYNRPPEGYPTEFHLYNDVMEVSVGYNTPMVIDNLIVDVLDYTNLVVELDGEIYDYDLNSKSWQKDVGYLLLKEWH